MKKVRKKNSGAARWRIQAQMTATEYGAAFVSGKNGITMIDVKGQCIAQHNDIIARAITKAPHYWTVLMSVMWIDESGNQHYAHDFLVTAERYIQANMTVWLNEEHKKLIDRWQIGRELLGVGWIAIPKKTTIPSGLANKIYTEMGFWE